MKIIFAIIFLFAGFAAGAQTKSLVVDKHGHVYTDSMQRTDDVKYKPAILHYQNLNNGARWDRPGLCLAVKYTNGQRANGFKYYYDKTHKEYAADSSLFISAQILPDNP